MLNIVVVLALAAFGLACVLCLVALLLSMRFNRSLQRHHPGVPRMNVFRIPAQASLHEETLQLGRQARAWLLGGLASFFVMALCGFILAALLPS